MHLRKSFIVVFILLLVLVNLMWLFRWENQVGGLNYDLKMDRWDKKEWAVHHFDRVFGYIEIPILDNSNLDLSSSHDVIEYTKKHAASGYIVDSWRSRDRITFFFILLNVVFIACLTLVVFPPKLKK